MTTTIDRGGAWAMSAHQDITGGSERDDEKFVMRVVEKFEAMCEQAGILDIYWLPKLGEVHGDADVDYDTDLLERMRDTAFEVTDI